MPSLGTLTITSAPLRDRTSDAFWTLASAHIAAAADCNREVEMEGMRNFLNSRMGRHLADKVGRLHFKRSPLEQALDEIVAQAPRSLGLPAPQMQSLAGSVLREELILGKRG
jgi:hypothetical protein